MTELSDIIESLRVIKQKQEEMDKKLDAFAKLYGLDRHYSTPSHPYGDYHEVKEDG